MTPEDTADYIGRHVKVAGRSDLLLSDDAITWIHNGARGIPTGGQRPRRARPEGRVRCENGDRRQETGPHRRHPKRPRLTHEHATSLHRRRRHHTEHGPFRYCGAAFCTSETSAPATTASSAYSATANNSLLPKLRIVLLYACPAYGHPSCRTSNPTRQVSTSRGQPSPAFTTDGWVIDSTVPRCWADYTMPAPGLSTSDQSRGLIARSWWVLSQNEGDHVRSRFHCPVLPHKWCLGA